MYPPKLAKLKPKLNGDANQASVRYTTYIEYKGMQTLCNRKHISKKILKIKRAQ